MPATALDRDLQTFAVLLFEHSGGAADWPAVELPGSVVVPRDVASGAHLPGEDFSLGVTAGEKTLQVGLAGEFLDVAVRVLELAVPRDGSFCIMERYLTSRDLTDKVASTFGWQNARGKRRTAEPALVEYHLWTLLGSIRSEDVWEAIFRVSINAESQAIVPLKDVFDEPDLRGGAGERAGRSGDVRHSGRRGKAGSSRPSRPSSCRRVEARAAGSEAAAGLLSGSRTRSRRLEASHCGGDNARGNRRQEAGRGSGTAPQARGAERELLRSEPSCGRSPWRGFACRRLSSRWLFNGNKRSGNIVSTGTRSRRSSKGFRAAAAGGRRFRRRL